MSTLYEDVKATGGYISNHASDLYIEVNEANRALLQKHGKRATTFVNQVTGKLCYDVPFSFDPFWANVASKADGKSKPDRVIYWVRSVGPSGKERIPMSFKGRLRRNTDEGMRGDVQARPLELGPGDFTATYGANDFENEDGTPFTD